MTFPSSPNVFGTSSPEHGKQQCSDLFGTGQPIPHHPFYPAPSTTIQDMESSTAKEGGIV